MFRAGDLSEEDLVGDTPTAEARPDVALQQLSTGAADEERRRNLYLGLSPGPSDIGRERENKEI